jgi:hypothetical protein
MAAKGWVDIEGGGTAPLPDFDTEWQLRYNLNPSRETLLKAAAIVSAYTALMVDATAERATQIVRSIRRASRAQSSPQRPESVIELVTDAEGEA